MKTAVGTAPAPEDRPVYLKRTTAIRKTLDASMDTTACLVDGMHLILEALKHSRRTSGLAEAALQDTELAERARRAS